MKEKEKCANDALRRTENTQIDLKNEMTNFESALFKTGWLDGFEFAKSNILRNLSLSCEANKIIEDVIKQTGEDEVEK